MAFGRSAMGKEMDKGCKPGSKKKPGGKTFKPFQKKKGQKR